MHKCMTAVGLTAQVQTFVQQSLCDVCACEHVPVVFFTFRLSVCHSIFPVSPTSRCSSVCVLFAHPYLSGGCAETFGWRSQRQAASVRSHAHAMYNPTERSHTHTNVEACGNAVSELKETRNKMLRDSKRWCLVSTSRVLTVTGNIFQLFNLVD